MVVGVARLFVSLPPFQLSLNSRAYQVETIFTRLKRSIHTRLSSLRKGQVDVLGPQLLSPHAGTIIVYMNLSQIAPFRVHVIDTISCTRYNFNHRQIGATEMAMSWTSPETGSQIAVVVVKEYDAAGTLMFLAHKATATSSKYVFGMRASDCRAA